MELIIPGLAAAATACIWLWIIRRYDRLEPEPLKTLLYAGLLGGLASTIPASILNKTMAWLLGIEIGATDVDFHKILLMYSFVGFNEEIWKALAAVLLMRNHPDFNEPIDGMIYALTVSLGFAAFENVIYIMQYGLSVIIVRSLLSIPAHLAFGAIWGYGFTKAKFLTPGHKYLATMAPFVFWSGLAHGVFDVVLASLGAAALILVILLVFFLLLYTRRKLHYLVEQSPFRELGRCLGCHTVNPKGSIFCANCGVDLRLDFYQICPKCQTWFGKSAAFCPQCGHKAADKRAHSGENSLSSE